MPQPAHEISGSWVNQNGSILEIKQDNGTLSGHYISRKGRSASGKRYPLGGAINGDVLSFYVDWQDDDANLESITSFSGRVERNADGIAAIHTMWVLVRRWEDQAQTRETGMWNAFLTNADVFTRLDPAAVPDR
ncbi:MAG: avidin/streptavidin family protein [Pseudomonadales bacterium]